MSFRQTQFANKNFAAKPAKQEEPKKKEEKSGYTIVEQNDSLSLHVEAAAYSKNKKMRLGDDYEKIARELSEKIGSQHQSLSITLSLAGLPYDDQIKLQKALMITIVARLKDSKFPLMHLSLTGWDIIGTVDDMKSELTKTQIQRHKTKTLRTLGISLRGYAPLQTLSLDDGNFNQYSLDSFFYCLINPNFDKNSSPITTLKRVSLIGSAVVDKHKKAANAHGMTLISVAPKKTVTNATSKSSTLKGAKVKSKKLVLRPVTQNESTEADFGDLTTYDEDLLNELDSLDTTPAKPLYNPPTRSILDFVKRISLSLLGAVAIGAPAGQIAMISIGLAATIGVGLAVGIAIFAGFVIAGVIYGFVTAERAHQASVADYNTNYQASLDDYHAKHDAKINQATSTHQNVVTNLKDKMSGMIVAYDALRDAQRAKTANAPKPTSSSAPARPAQTSSSSASRMYTPSKMDKPIIMDETPPTAVPSLGK